MSLNRWMSEDFDEVLFILIQWHMLSILSLQKASVIGSEQNGLLVSNTILPLPGHGPTIKRTLVCSGSGMIFGNTLNAWFVLYPLTHD